MPSGTPPLPPALLLSTGILLVSSWSVQLAVRAARAGRQEQLVHSLGATLALAVALAKARAGRYSPQEHAGVVLCAMYWHALDAIWVVLYGTLWAGSR